MKSFKVFTEEKELNEAKNPTTAKWNVVEIKREYGNDYAYIEGKSGEYTAKVTLNLDLRYGWRLTGTIVNEENNIVARVAITKLKRLKTLESKWKKEHGKHVKCPDRAFLEPVMKKINESYTSNFFYVSPPDDD